MEEGNIKEYTLDDVSALFIYTERTVIKFNDGRSISKTETNISTFSSFVEYIISAKEFVKSEYPEFTVWMLEDNECIGCDEKYSCGTSGYCAPCWNERYGCEDL
jgi:hypothetical protein